MPRNEHIQGAPHLQVSLIGRWICNLCDKGTRNKSGGFVNSSVVGADPSVTASELDWQRYSTTVDIFLKWESVTESFCHSPCSLEVLT